MNFCSPCFSNSREIFRENLSTKGQKLARVTKYQGSVRVDIREWQRRNPTMFGVSLTIPQYRFLEHNFLRLSTALDRSMAKKRVDLKIDLHMNIYATINSPYTCINIREWYRPAHGGLEAGRCGISLNLTEWKKLRQVARNISACLS